MLGFDNLRGPLERPRPFVHPHDFCLVTDVCARTTTPGPRGFRTGAGSAAKKQSHESDTRKNVPSESCSKQNHQGRQDRCRRKDTEHAQERRVGPDGRGASRCDGEAKKISPRNLHRETPFHLRSIRLARKRNGTIKLKWRAILSGDASRRYKARSREKAPAPCTMIKRASASASR